jgi:hypothetical protein
VCHEREKLEKGKSRVTAFPMRDGPSAIGLQERIPNHLRRLWSKAMVVSAKAKGPAMTGSGSRQEED